MASPNEDVKWLVTTRLLETSAVTGIVGDRVVTEHSIPGEVDLATVEMPRVIVDLISGDARWHGAVQTVIFHVYAYSRASQGEASRLYGEVWKALHAQGLRDTQDVIKAAGITHETERPQEGHNGNMNAFFSRGVWVFRGSTGWNQ